MLSSLFNWFKSPSVLYFHKLNSTYLTTCIYQPCNVFINSRNKVNSPFNQGNRTCIINELDFVHQVIHTYHFVFCIVLILVNSTSDYFLLNMSVTNHKDLVMIKNCSLLGQPLISISSLGGTRSPPRRVAFAQHINYFVFYLLHPFNLPLFPLTVTPRAPEQSFAHSSTSSEIVGSALSHCTECFDLLSIYWTLNGRAVE